MQSYAHNSNPSNCSPLFPWKLGPTSLESISGRIRRTPKTFSSWRGSPAHRSWWYRVHAETDGDGFLYYPARYEGVVFPVHSTWSRRPYSQTRRGTKTSRSPAAGFTIGADKAGRTSNSWRSLQLQEMGSFKLFRITPWPEGQRLPNLPRVCANAVKKTGFALRSCFKRFTGPPHPDRERQFKFIENKKAAFLKTGDPILSADTKKKELIGNFANTGHVWRRHAIDVNAHDFKKDSQGRAVPYGLYDVSGHTGHVQLGISGDTPAFAVGSIAYWWQTEGQVAYRGHRQLLLLADAGGSNDCRKCAWKYHLQKDLADRFNLTIHVSHYPTGASKWNPVEHRLFGPISTNWAREPLSTFGEMLRLIRGTKGLTVTAHLNRRKYETGEKITPEQIDSLHCARSRVCPTWNYIITPRGNQHAIQPLPSGP